MNLLVGLPLKLFHVLFLVVRLAWPLLLGLVIYIVIKKLRKKGNEAFFWQQDSKKPDFDGPVIHVDYRVVDEEE